LVVEDDEDLRELLRDALEEAGYAVVAACTGREAMNVLEKLSLATWSTGAVDLVLTDLYVPEVTGAELVRLLRTARWPVPVVLMTAYASTVLRESTRAMGIPLLEKPFTLEEMRTTVRAELLRIRPA
jgi:two-component system cell cycle sensor histidine kinase/response regulator CckA